MGKEFQKLSELRRQPRMAVSGFPCFEAQTATLWEVSEFRHHSCSGLACNSGEKVYS